MRYQGQSFELQIKYTAGDIISAFHRAHRARYGYAQARNMVEIVSARVRSIGVIKKVKILRSKSVPATVAKPDDFTHAHLGGGKSRIAVFRRENLKAGSRLRVPCIVTEYSATTLIPGGARAATDPYGNLIVE